MIPAPCIAGYAAARRSYNLNESGPEGRSEAIRIQGAIAQLGERLLCTQEVGGSIPPGSTTPSLWRGANNVAVTDKGFDHRHGPGITAL